MSDSENPDRHWWNSPAVSAVGTVVFLGSAIWSAVLNHQLQPIAWFLGLLFLADLTVRDRIPERLVVLSPRRLWVGGGMLLVVGAGMMFLPLASVLDPWLDYPVRFLFSVAGILLAVLGAQIGGWGSRLWVRHRAK